MSLIACGAEWAVHRLSAHGTAAGRTGLPTMVLLVGLGIALAAAILAPRFRPRSAPGSPPDPEGSQDVYTVP